MKIIWSEFASETLKEIYIFYKINASIKVANTIKKTIFTTTSLLIKHPLLGQKEPLLEKLNENHRFLIAKNYKIIYKIVNKKILITDIFDVRQNPIKINRTK